jgi:hypothetical protein
VLSEMEQRGRSFSEALRAAQELGLAEPDAQRDVSGLDAADKLAIVLRELGASGVRPGAIETRGIEGLDPGDLAQACELGGRIRPLVWASRGPTWLASDHPLAAVRGADNAIQLRGRQIGNLLYSGPGAGPEVTAATILDDVVEAVAGASTESGAVNAGGPSAAVAELEHAAGTLPYGRRCAQVVSPATPWFVRLRFGESAPAFGDLCSLLGSYAIWFRQTRWGRTAGRAQALYGLTGRCSRSRLEAALRVVEDATGGRSFACRALEDERCR